MTWVIRTKAFNLEKSWSSIPYQSNVKKIKFKNRILIIQKDFKKHQLKEWESKLKWKINFIFN